MVKGIGSPSSKQVENPNANLPAPEGMDQMLKIVCSTIARRESLIFRYVRHDQMPNGVLCSVVLWFGRVC